MKEITQKLLQKLNYENDSLESVECDGKTYSYRVENEIVFVCVTTEVFGRSAAALFLKYINQMFDEQFGIRGKMTKLQLDMNRDFAPTLKKQMEMYSTESGIEKLEALRHDLDAVKDNVHNNIHKILERGDKIDLLVDKSEQLNTQSAAFAQASKNLRQHLWWQNVKMMIVIGILCACFMALVVLYVKKKVT